MPSQRRLDHKSTLEALVMSMKLLKEATEVVSAPVPSSLLDMAISRLEKIKALRTNKDIGEDLAEHIVHHVSTIYHELSRQALYNIVKMNELVGSYVNVMKRCDTTLATLSQRSQLARQMFRHKDRTDLETISVWLNEEFSSFMIAIGGQPRQSISLRPSSGYSVKSGLSLPSAKSPYDQLPRTPRTPASGVTASRPCLSGTRIALLDEIRRWAVDDSEEGKPIYWLRDLPGSGKSALAQQINLDFKEANLFNAIYAFSKGADSSNSSSMCDSWADEVAEAFPETRVAIRNAQKEKRTKEFSSFSQEFHALVLGPLSDRPAPDTPSPCLIFIVDAIDECPSDERIEVLQALKSATLTNPVKFFITSQLAVPDVMEELNDNPQVTQAAIDIHSPSNVADILLYLTVQFRRSPIKREDFRSTLVSPTIRALARRADGLFIWAVQAFRLLQSSKNPTELLVRLFSEEMYTHVDGLYTELLLQTQEILDLETPPVPKSAISTVLGAIGYAPIPLSLDCLTLLLGNTYAEQVLQHLQGVISSESRSESIQILHITFRDFICKKHLPTLISSLSDFRFIRSPSFHSAHSTLAQGCLRILKTKLKQNICNIHSGVVLNAEVLDLEARVALYITEDILFASRFWPFHCAEALKSREERDEHDGEWDVEGSILELFRSQLLEWFEVLSLTQYLTDGVQGLMVLSERVQSIGGMPELEQWVYDSIRFTETNQNLLERSAAHIYISAIPFVPRSSLIFTTYAAKFNTKAPILIRPILENWSRELILRQSSPVSCLEISSTGRTLAFGTSDGGVNLHLLKSGIPSWSSLKGHTSGVTCLTFSPDGSVLASGSKDMTIRLWDPSANQGLGVALGGPLQGHIDAITSLSFSPDGKLLASGSDDVMVRLWDVEKGKLCGRPMTGHEQNVRCVAFSPDGQRIASGSQDETVRIWDVATGECIGEPLRGHKDWVAVVTWSLEGDLIASSSFDSTIRLWNVKEHVALGGPYEGHRDTVHQLKFLPKTGSGIRRLVSSSLDETVRIWDVDGGKTIVGPLRNGGFVSSLALTKDGTRVASASSDKCIRVWSTEDGREIGDAAFRGHEGAISSLYFTPDGSILASGSHDCTVRLWSIEESKDPSPTPSSTIARPQDPWITCVAFSPDGKRLACGSSNRSVTLWDAETGSRIGKPMSGHTDWVISVSFSEDGKQVASASYDKLVHLWDATTCEPIGEPYHSDNPILSIEQGGNVPEVEFSDLFHPVGFSVSGHSNSDHKGESVGEPSPNKRNVYIYRENGWVYRQRDSSSPSSYNQSSSHQRIFYVPPMYQPAPASVSPQWWIHGTLLATVVGSRLSLINFKNCC